MKNSILITIIVVILAAGVAFIAGMKYQEGKGGNSAFNGQRTGPFRQRFGNTQPVRGEIISSDDKSLTVKLQDGSSKIVIFGSSTTITQTASASKQDLKTGIQVLVLGNSNSDGSVTAQMIQLNPQIRQGQNNNSQ